VARFRGGAAGADGRGAACGGRRAAGAAAFPGAAGLIERAPGASRARAGLVAAGRAVTRRVTVTAGRVIPGPLVRSPAEVRGAVAPRRGRAEPSLGPATGRTAPRAAGVDALGMPAVSPLLRGVATRRGAAAPAPDVRAALAVTARLAAAGWDVTVRLTPANLGRSGLALARTLLLAPAPTRWGERPVLRGFGERPAAALRVDGAVARRAVFALVAGWVPRALVDGCLAAAAGLAGGNSSSRASGSTLLRLVLISRPRARRRSTASSLVMPSRLASS
jgi:hypothetical protein